MHNFRFSLIVAGQSMSHEEILDVTDRVCSAVADYHFTNVTQLARDFRDGRFAAAFPSLKTYTGYRLPDDKGLE